MRRERLSCTVICYDEEENIRAALESVKWCDEIVVVDSFSTDRTLEICREYTDRIYQRRVAGLRRAEGVRARAGAPPMGAEPRRRRARVAGAAARDRGRAAASRDADGYYVPRLVYYLGRWWWRGGWYPDYRLRLFRRDAVVLGRHRSAREGDPPRTRSARLREPAPALHLPRHRAITSRTINGFTGVAAARARCCAAASRRCVGPGPAPALALRALLRAAARVHGGARRPLRRAVGGVLRLRAVRQALGGDRTTCAARCRLASRPGCRD